MKYQLADTSTGFFDPATGFKIVRDEVAEIKDPGIKTQAAIRAGRLVAVGSTGKAAADDGEGDGKAAKTSTKSAAKK